MSFKIEKIEGGLFADDRGFLRFINDFDFSQVKRFYQVENHSAGFIRAWHGHKKMETEEIHKFTLSSQKPCILCVPEGYANGFKTLEDETIIIFFSSSTLEESHGDDYRFEWDKWDIWKENYR
jgi:dTDP-4-dehydrorhamnose 3,5-epimerase